MRRDQLWAGAFGIALLTLVTAGCDDTAKGVKKDAEEAKPYVDAAAAEAKEKFKEAADAAKPAAEEAGEKLKELGGKAVEGAKDLGDKAADGARKAGDKIEDGADRAGDKIEDGADRAGDKTARGADKAGDKAESAGDAVSAAAQTTMVKAALVADKNVDASRIDVDTDGGTKTVMLKGSVPSAAMKTTAERIAKGKVSKGYSVHNMLTVAKP
jgi:hyperosmotically inducible periplasmic protein